MKLFRSSRFYYRLIIELSHKYTKALVFGFFVGVIGSISAIRVMPFILQRFFLPVERIGVIGEFTPSSLPLFIQQQISTGLTMIAADGSALSGLSTRWEASDSGKQYIFYLSDKKKWHTGKKVTAYDINYNIRDVILEPLNETTLKVTLKDPYAPFPTLVVKPVLQASLVGFGPYKVGSIRLKGDQVEYLKLVPVNDPKALGQEYRFYKTESQALTAYKLGEIDTITEVSTKEGLEDVKNTTVTTKIRYDRVVGLFFNLNDQLLQEKNVRQGLGYLVPDLGQELARSPISKTSWAYTDIGKKYTYDENQSKRLLRTTLSASNSALLTISTFAPYVDEAQKIANSWTAAGIETKVKVENAISSDFQILLSAQTVPPDPDQYPFWHSTQKNTNITGYANVKIDKLLEDGRQKMDLESRKKIYSDFVKYLTDDTPVIFLYYPKTYSIQRKKER